MQTSPNPAGGTGQASASHPGESRRSSATVRLPAELGIDQADSLRQELLRHLGDADPVTLDAAEVQRIHTAALQLFCMFCRDRRAAGHEVAWHRPSQVLRSAAALLGATTLLNMSTEQGELA